MQDPVDLAVAAAGQAVAHLVTGAGVDGCGASPGREVVVVGEPGDVTDFDQQAGRAGGADAGQAGQAGAGLGEQRGELFVR